MERKCAVIELNIKLNKSVFIFLKMQWFFSAQTFNKFYWHRLLPIPTNHLYHIIFTFSYIFCTDVILSFTTSFPLLFSECCFSFFSRSFICILILGKYPKFSQDSSWFLFKLSSGTMLYSMQLNYSLNAHLLWSQ